MTIFEAVIKIVIDWSMTILGSQKSQDMAFYEMSLTGQWRFLVGLEKVRIWPFMKGHWPANDNFYGVSKKSGYGLLWNVIDQSMTILKAVIKIVIDRSMTIFIGSRKSQDGDS